MNPNGLHIVHHATVDSTNSVAQRLLTGTRRPATPTVVVADGQSAGRGTRGRAWRSPSGAGLYFTVMSPALPGCPATDMVALARAAGVACCSTLWDLLAVAVRLRGVNDLMVGGRKVGGILVEFGVSAGRVDWILTGVGVNCRAHPSTSAAPDLAATCLADHLEGGFDSFPAALGSVLRPGARHVVPHRGGHARAKQEIRRSSENDSAGCERTAHELNGAHHGLPGEPLIRALSTAILTWQRLALDAPSAIEDAVRRWAMDPAVR